MRSFLPNGEFDAARIADEQALPEAFLEPADLVAERADRQVHRLRRPRQIAEAGRGDEALEGMERWAHRTSLT